jgi:anti-sigma B factor antagonist
MFELERVDSQRIRLKGRFDAAQEARVKDVLDQVPGSVTLDCEELTYISSAGLGVLVATQLRLSKQGGELRLTRVNAHIQELLKLSGLDRVIPVS